MNTYSHRNIAEFTKTRTLSFSKQAEIYIEYLVALSIQPHLNIGKKNFFFFSLLLFILNMVISI